MSSMFQNLGGIRRGMVRPQANAPQGLGNPAQSQEDQLAPQGGSSFLPQGDGAAPGGGPPQAQLGAFMDRLAKMRPNTGEAGGGLPGNYGQGGGRGYAGGTPRPDFGGRKPVGAQQGNDTGGGGGLGGAPGPSMGRPSKAAAAATMQGGGPIPPGGASKAPFAGGQPAPGGAPQPGGGSPWGAWGPPSSWGGAAPMMQGGPARPAPGAVQATPPAGQQPGPAAPQLQGGMTASNIYNPQGQMASAAAPQAPVSRAGAPGAAPQSDGAAPGAPSHRAAPLASGANLGGKTREDYTQAGDAAGGI